jgi:hypothetical protein
VQAGMCESRKESLRSGREDCGQAGECAGRQASKCKYVRAGVRAPCWQGVLAGRGVCAQAIECACWQGGVWAGREMYGQAAWRV